MARTNRPFFSVVIPCYNDGRYAPGVYIDRLLNNITEQGLNKNEIEVIIADDHSKIPYQGTLDRYSDKLIIRYVETDYNFGPGNTRQKGSTVATGKWLCFADHDDLFYPGALKYVKSQITKTKEQLMVYSDFNKVSHDDLDKVIEEFRVPHLSTWVHGKFYNLDNFWKKYSIHFVKDLKTHEDIALGNYVDSVLHSLNYSPLHITQPVYKWIHASDSVSHGSYTSSVSSDGTVHSFIETHFDDFVSCNITPLLEAYDNKIITKDEAIVMVIFKLGTLWMFCCKFKLSNPQTYLKQTEAFCSRAWHSIKEKLNINPAFVKVVMSTKLADAKQRLDVIAHPEGYDFNSWLDMLNTEDFSILLDAFDAANRRNSRAVCSNADQEGHRPFFSLVIACYNDGRYKENTYLDRLLASVTRQGIAKEDIEVILSDDCSPVPFDSIIAKYEDRLTIKYVKTDYNFAPGNTRAKGVGIATGEWLCFADHDDIFYDMAMSKIRNAIQEKNEQHFIFGDFNGVNPEGEIIRKYECHLNWCHGKFYNKDNLWDKYNIHFIHDLKSHEDIAICTQVSCVLSTYLPNYSYVHTPVYAWTDNPQSVSHAKYTVETEEGPREFLEVFFEDYVTSTGYIYLDYFNAKKIKMTQTIKWVLEIMCYCYFYMQGFQFRRPDDFWKKNIDVAGKFVSTCKKTFNLTNQTIYDAVASNKAYMYYHIMELANSASGRYIPTQTFRQWLELVSP